jgi:myosin-5
LLLATAATFAQKLYSNFQQKQHSYFEKPRFSNVQFTVKHYAGPVTYTTDNFLDKNKDYVVPEHISMLEKSNLPFIKGMFVDFWTSQQSAQTQGKAPGKTPGKQDTKTGVQFVSVGSQFRVISRC